jgi:pyruvate formate lyase activating enzyme
MIDNAEATGIVFDIQRFSIHDGPGIRTTVFLKGCSLRCFWCHNPEGIRMKPEIRFDPARCIGCGACVAVCDHGAQQMDAEGHRGYNRELCIVCGQCVKECFAEGLVLTGKEMTAAEVAAEVLRDRAFYEQSRGGVTLSGGDPVLQREFSRAILAACRAEGVHTAIETAGNYPWEHLAGLLPVTDLVMMDLKHMDPEKHRQATGATNERVLVTAERLATTTDKPILFRIPVVPGVNDRPEDVAAIGRYVAGLADARRAMSGAQNGAAQIALELLAFHRLASQKYASLGLDYRAAEINPPTPEHMAELKAIVAALNVSATLTIGF